MEYNWEEPGKSKKSTIWSHFDEEKAKCKWSLLRPNVAFQRQEILPDGDKSLDSLVFLKHNK